MTELFSLLANNADRLISIIIIIVLGVDRLRSGSSTVRKEIAADYKERNEQLDLKVKTLESNDHQRQIEIASMKASFEATLKEKDKHIELLTKTLQDRNPDTMNILKEIKNLNSKIIEFMRQDRNTLEYQTRLLEFGAKRDKNIDEASIKHEGEPLLTPRPEEDNKPK